MKMTRIAAAIGVAAQSLALLGQTPAMDSLPRPDREKPPAASALQQPSRNDAKDSLREGGKPSRDARQNGKPEKDRVSFSEAVKKLLEEIKAAEAIFLKEQKDLQEKIRDATDDQRDRLRVVIQDKREQFLQQQKDMRDEFRRRVNELREELKDHGELFEQPKEMARERIRQRKGGDN